MNDKKCNRGYASEELMHKIKEMRALNEEQVCRELIANVLLLINELQFSIYKFLTLKAKNVESVLNWSSFDSIG